MTSIPTEIVVGLITLIGIIITVIINRQSSRDETKATNVTTHVQSLDTQVRELRAHVNKLDREIQYLRHHNWELKRELGNATDHAIAVEVWDRNGRITAMPHTKRIDYWKQILDKPMMPDES
ncbi:D52 family tumor protein [Corynebacterium propinquum]|uniref:D52 family tumor protein n=1 Tax=Corynebacterium propinquum TaxID=43769 RepID=A0AAP4BTI1_9CORY|nr:MULTISPECIES: D52 family tumor protein [Corynebacterium]MCG7231034.1 D52 family tumor protein [Corynebacterium propinquum]MDK4252755.1 D52 family tumor protein [Corynebacterium propinquum]MDK4326145.1 D52 family tumor protein [Corynebacterium propinquum]MDK8701165.1 D52 family tumor protein [Corynebacterium pseudodiphtheriticum]